MLVNLINKELSKFIINQVKHFLQHLLNHQMMKIEQVIKCHVLFICTAMREIKWKAWRTWSQYSLKESTFALLIFQGAEIPKANMSHLVLKNNMILNRLLNIYMKIIECQLLAFGEEVWAPQLLCSI